MLSEACKSLTQELTETSKEISIVNFESEEKVFDSLIFKIVKAKDWPYKIEILDSAMPRYKLENSAMMFFETVDSLEDFNMKVALTNKYAKKLKFFIYIKTATFDEIESLHELETLRPQSKGPMDFNHRTGILQFQYFIVHDESSFRLLTFEWFALNNCKVPRLAEVNRFDTKARKWKSSNFEMQKFVNFNHCELVFGVPGIEHSFEYEIKGQEVLYSGFHHEVLHGLAKNLKFRVALNPFVTGEYRFKNLRVDFFVVLAPLNLYGMDLNFITQPYMFYNDYVLIPPGENYSGYEKMLLPFEEEVWAVIVFIFATAFSAIFIINLMRLGVRTFFYGRRVTSPALNVAMIFFGISQTLLPRRSFARFLLMLFVLYSLIIRTAYQGKMFEFMQQYMTKSEVQTINEMIDNNYTLFMLKGLPSVYKDMDVFKR